MSAESSYVYVDKNNYNLDMCGIPVEYASRQKYDIFFIIAVDETSILPDVNNGYS